MHLAIDTVALLGVNAYGVASPCDVLSRMNQSLVQVEYEELAFAGKGSTLTLLHPHIRVQRLQIDQTLNCVQQMLAMQVARFTS